MLSWKTIHLHIFYMHLIVHVLGKWLVLHVGQELLTTFPEHLVSPFKKRSTLHKEMYTTIFVSPGLMILNADFIKSFLNACSYGWYCTESFVLSCLCYSIFVFGLLVCPCLFLSSVLYFLPSMLRVHMVGSVRTLLSGLCLSMFVFGLLCCHWGPT